ncbi:hypothetical protein ABZW18_10355 [Streptomyces sp. NPDC004647]|uniref:hypothetical protein n=1 Tax=Streptomyces sp. NPDC004647 TaxID=3154671 RepID=UPI0033B47F08
MWVGEAITKVLGTAVNWILIAIAALALIGVLRGISALLMRLRSRGRLLPLVLYQERQAGADGGEQAGSYGLTAHLAAHLGEHQSDNILAPGSSSAASADATAQEAGGPHRWLEALLRLAVSNPPAYRIHLLELQGTDDSPRRGVVRIERVPQNRIIAARVMEGDDEEKLVEATAAYCFMQVHNQGEMLRRMPRWERWGDDVRALTHYRHGSYLQRCIRQDDGGGETDYSAALTALSTAARYAPSNLVIRLNEAALAELVHAHDPERYEQQAITLYARCTQLWPEHIETAYRIAIAYSRIARPLLRSADLPPQETIRLEAAARNARLHLEDIRRRLRFSSLLRRWMRTFVPGGRSNSGERRYWGAWLTPLPLPARRSRRRTFRGAITIALAAHDLTGIRRNGLTVDAAAHSADRQQCTVRHAFDQVAKEVLVRSRFRAPGAGMRRLLFPDHANSGHAHDEVEHRSLEDRRATSRHWGPVRKGSAGWMTHYNAACFLALASNLPDASLPSDYSSDHWREDCTRSALNQLDRSLRTPDSALTGDWISHDADLDPLWDTKAGKEWAEFMNIHIATR